MSASRDKLRLIAPEQTDTPDATVDFFLETAAAQVGPSVWGALYEQGVLYLAAHLMALRDRGLSAGASGGAVTAVKTGDLSVSFGGTMAGGSHEASLAETTHGREYLRLLRMVTAGPYIA